MLRDRWLPPNKKAAVVFTIDDIHPGRSVDAYEAGGDLDKGALGQVAGLLARHPALWVTLFTTPDWRQISPRPTKRLLSRIPVLRDRVFLTDVLPEGTMRLDRHPAFTRYLAGAARTEVGLHGLHHIHPGTTPVIEFQEQSRAVCRRTLEKSMAIFDRAGLPYVRGMQPPGWNAPPALCDAMADLDFHFVASARDVVTPITKDAVTNMSGIHGVSLLYPDLVSSGRLLHFTSNFQATSPVERALAILDAGGLLAVKAHIVKAAMGYTALDGVDPLYMNYLDALFTLIEDRYGEDVWWTSMGQVAQRVRDVTRADRQVEPLVEKNA